VSDGDLRKIFRNHLPMVAWSTIETGAVEPGVADLNGLLNGVEFWVENKRTLAYAVEVKPSQVAWHRLRWAKRGRTFFAVRRCGSELWLIEGRHALQLKDYGLRDCPTLLVADGGPARWPWARVLDLLVGH
jgi:hypothetical protein